VRYYPSAAVAAAAGISIPTLYRRWAEGKGPACEYHGRFRLVAEPELHRWLLNGAGKP